MWSNIILLLLAVTFNAMINRSIMYDDVHTVHTRVNSDKFLRGILACVRVCDVYTAAVLMWNMKMMDGPVCRLDICSKQIGLQWLINGLCSTVIRHTAPLLGSSHFSIITASPQTHTFTHPCAHTRRTLKKEPALKCIKTHTHTHTPTAWEWDIIEGKYESIKQYKRQQVETPQGRHLSLSLSNLLSFYWDSREAEKDTQSVLAGLRSSVSRGTCGCRGGALTLLTHTHTHLHTQTQTLFFQQERLHAGTETKGRHTLYTHVQTHAHQASTHTHKQTHNNRDWDKRL